MKKHTILALLTLVIVCLISACSKKSDPTPTSPIVGQWDIQRIVFGDFPTAYAAQYNGYTDSSVANSGTDTYIFSADNTYSETYATTTSTGATGSASEAGGWALANTSLALTPTSPAGTNPYVLTYNNSNELTSGKFGGTDSLVNPTTNVVQPVSFSFYYVYRKKK